MARIEGWLNTPYGRIGGPLYTNEEGDEERGYRVGITISVTSEDLGEIYRRLRG